MICSERPIEEEYESRYLKTSAEIAAIPEHIPIVIWTAENADEQTGIRYLLYLLKEKTSDVFHWGIYAFLIASILLNRLLQK